MLCSACLADPHLLQGGRGASVEVVPISLRFACVPDIPHLAQGDAGGGPDDAAANHFAADLGGSNLRQVDVVDKLENRGSGSLGRAVSKLD